MRVIDKLLGKRKIMVNTKNNITNNKNKKRQYQYLGLLISFTNAIGLYT